MHVFKGHVKDGKIELDEDVELPEGAEVKVTLNPTAEPMSREEWRQHLTDVEVKAGRRRLEDGLVTDEEEQQLLEEALERGIADSRAGRVVSAEEVHRRLRALREG